MSLKTAWPIELIPGQLGLLYREAQSQGIKRMKGRKEGRKEGRKDGRKKLRVDEMAQRVTEHSDDLSFLTLTTYAVGQNWHSQLSSAFDTLAVPHAFIHAYKHNKYIF